MSDMDKRRPFPDFPSENDIRAADEMRAAFDAMARALDKAAAAMKEFSKAAKRLDYRGGPR